VLEIKGSYGTRLLGKTIVHCLTGSVSVYKAVDIARYLIRYGANVIPVMSNDASRLISPYLMEFATGNKVVKKITGKIEHVKIFEENNVDLVLIAPATANSISKIANGISDTAVTLVASIALGKNIPVLIAPAMHEPMYFNKNVLENIERLKKQNVEFINPRIEEGKAKIATEKEIYFKVSEILTEKDLKNKNIVVTAGATREYIDAVRFISNPSSGKMGVWLAIEAKIRGANVYLLHGDLKTEIPGEIEAIHCKTSKDMIEEIEKIFSKNKIDYFISAAGITDYKPTKRFEGKIDTKSVKKITIELETTPKIIRYVKEIAKEAKVVAFKAEYGLDERKISEIAPEYDFADFIIFNDISRQDIGFESEYNEVTIFHREKMKKIGRLKKEELAKQIWDFLVKEIGN